MKSVLVLGAGGFIGNHLVKKLKREGYFVRAADFKLPEFSKSEADEFLLGDLRDLKFMKEVYNQAFDRIYQLAADMGGAGYIFTGLHDADIMTNSLQINLNLLYCAKEIKSGIHFFASSACIYPDTNHSYEETLAYPAMPDSEYGWEKLMSERLYQAHARNYGLHVRIGRLHNIFGTEGIFDGGKEKAIAAICRKVAQSKDGETIEIWGDGKQQRSFLYIDECLEGIEKLVQSNLEIPVNIGSDEVVSIQDLTELIITIANKELKIKNISGPTGVLTRTSHNALILKEINWAPNYPLKKGVEKTYEWIAQQIIKKSI